MQLPLACHPELDKNNIFPGFFWGRMAGGGESEPAGAWQTCRQTLSHLLRHMHLDLSQHVMRNVSRFRLRA
eukprot:879491-Pelagomonas_calceolata.AAC.1